MIDITRITPKEGQDIRAYSHIDYPNYLKDQGKSSTAYDMDRYIGLCYVKDCSYLNERILKRDLQAINIDTYDFILFKTQNSSRGLDTEDFIYMSQEAAHYLADFSLKAVGVDGVSLERAQDNLCGHSLLLEADVLIYEGLDLSQVDEGVYEFLGLPLRQEDRQQIPVRALLKKKY